MEADGDLEADTSVAGARNPAAAPRRTRATTKKVSQSKAEAMKTAKLEAERKRKRGEDSTPPAEDVIVESASEDEVVAPRSPSPETKRKKEETLKVTEEDLCRYKESLITKAGAQRRVPVRPPPRPLCPQMRKNSK